MEPAAPAGHVGGHSDISLALRLCQPKILSHKRPCDWLLPTAVCQPAEMDQRNELSNGATSHVEASPDLPFCAQVRVHGDNGVGFKKPFHMVIRE